MEARGGASQRSLECSVAYAFYKREEKRKVALYMGDMAR
jgi:hypothetical protein